MSYDHWKTTNPADQFLGPEPGKDEPEPDDGMGLLPAWFVPRMMRDEWCFGLLLVTGKILVISHIDVIRRDASGALWLDVTMLENKEASFITPYIGGHQMGFITAPTSRLRASVQASHVVAAIELADT